MIKPSLPRRRAFHPLDDGLLLWLPAYEGSGSQANDISGYDIHLTPGTAPTWSGSRRGWAINLNGTSQNLQSSRWQSYNPTAAITVACWVNGPAQDNQVVVSHYDTGSNQRAWSLQSANSAWTPGTTSHLGIIISQNGTTSTNYKVYEATDSDAFDGMWHHVAFTFSGGGGLELYVDGRKQTTSKITNLSVTSLHDSTANLMLGGLFVTGSPSNLWQGMVEDLRIWDRVLSQPEVARVAALPWERPLPLMIPGGGGILPQVHAYRQLIGEI